MNDSLDANDIAHAYGTDVLRTAIDHGALAASKNQYDARNSADGDPKLPASRPQSDWREPKSLPDDLPPVPEFRLDFLPSSVAPFAADISDRMQCPPDFVTIPLIVALGAALGRKIGIRPQRETTWTEVANFWGCIIGRPGAMKSPAISEALKPMRRLELRARDTNIEARKEFEAEKVEYKIRKEAAEKQAKNLLKSGKEIPENLLRLAEPDEPTARRYIVNDTTYEALGEILAANPNGLLACRDELVSLLKTLDREEYAAARSFFLTAWNGTDSYTFDRILRGHTHIESACLSLLGSTQPGKIAPYVRRALSGGSGDDGMLQRFSLLVWPNQTTEYRETDRPPNALARDSAWRVFQALDMLDPETVSAERDSPDGLPFLRLDVAALAHFQHWRVDLERRLRVAEWHPALESHFAKYRKLVPTLALVNHLADHGTGPISENAMQRALELSSYLEKHAYRVYGASRQHEIVAADAILKRIRKGDIEDGFTARDVYQHDWSNLTDAEQVQAALNLLVDLDWLCDVTERTGGRPKTKYSINPLVHR